MMNIIDIIAIIPYFITLATVVAEEDDLVRPPHNQPDSYQDSRIIFFPFTFQDVLTSGTRKCSRKTHKPGNVTCHPSCYSIGSSI